MNDSSITYPEGHQTPEVSTFGNPRSVWHWTLNLLIFTIPIVNFVVLIIWATGIMGTGEIKKNFARAYLIIFGIIYLILIVVFIIAIIISFSTQPDTY